MVSDNCKHTAAQVMAELGNVCPLCLLELNKTALEFAELQLTAKDKRIAELEARNKTLVVYMAQLLAKSRGWGSLEITAEDVQEWAILSGVFVLAPGGYDPEKHGEHDYCDPGDEFYDLAGWLRDEIDALGEEVDGGK